MRTLVLAVLLALPATALAESARLTERVESLRFLEPEVRGPAFGVGTRVEVLLREGDRVRVREGDRYGWVPADSLEAIPEALDELAVELAPRPLDLDRPLQGVPQPQVPVVEDADRQP